MSLRRLHKHARREIKCSGLLLGREKPVFLNFSHFFLFQTSALEHSPVFLQLCFINFFGLSGKNKTERDNRRSKKKKTRFNVQPYWPHCQSITSVIYCRPDDYSPHAALRVVLFIIRKSNNLPLKKKKKEQQQKKSSKNKTKQTKQKQREDVYVRQTKKINSTSTKNVAFT